jgi:hypothetical protein
MTGKKTFLLTFLIDFLKSTYFIHSSWFISGFMVHGSWFMVHGLFIKIYFPKLKTLKTFLLHFPQK